MPPMEGTESGLSSSSVVMEIEEFKEKRTPLLVDGSSETGEVSAPQQDEPQTVKAEVPKKSFKFKVTVFMICLVSVVVAMDSVIVAATLPAIAVALKGTSLEAFWVGTSYLLAQTVSVLSRNVVVVLCHEDRPSLPLIGNNPSIWDYIGYFVSVLDLSGRTELTFPQSGRKWVMIFAICLFLFGSILCGCAQNMNWLVAARVVQGLGGGGVLTLATVIISDITTLRERPKFLAMGAFAWALGTNIGVNFPFPLFRT